MNARCRYCGKEIAGDQGIFCDADCAAAYESSVRSKVGHMKHLLMGLALSLLVILWGPLSGNEILVGVGVAILGFVVARWPLATPETVQAVGYVPSCEICRAIGVTIVPLGLLLSLWM